MGINNFCVNSNTTSLRRGISDFLPQHSPTPGTKTILTQLETPNTYKLLRLPFLMRKYLQCQIERNKQFNRGKRNLILSLRQHIPVIIGTPDFQLWGAFVRVDQLEVGRVDASQVVRRRRRRGAGESPEHDPRRLRAFLDAHLFAREEAFQIAAGRGRDNREREKR